MEVSPRYLGGDSPLGRRDPRVLVLVPVAAVVAAAQVRDLRVMALLALAALGYYLCARIPFHQVRSNWAAVAFFVVLFAGINGLVVGATQDVETRPLLDLPPGPLTGPGSVTASVSVAAASYAATLVLRFLTVVSVGFPLAFAVRPGDLSVAFARLGLPQWFAYGIDLTFRFLPSTAEHLRETVAAQRLRGYQRSATRNPLRRLAEVRPLLVPVAVGAFVDAEDTVDALDLRGFGTQRRTWLRELRLGPGDWAVLAVAGGVAVAATAVNVAGVMPGLYQW